MIAEMAKKKTSAPLAAVSSEVEAVKLLGELEELTKKIEPLQKRAIEIKDMVTKFAVSREIDVITLDDCYYRKIQRPTRTWVGTDAQMPDPKPKGAKSVYSIVKGKTVKGKKLWNLVTRRVVDPALIDLAVKEGWITEKEIGKAFIEKDQKPFLTRYSGSPE